MEHVSTVRVLIFLFFFSFFPRSCICLSFFALVVVVEGTWIARVYHCFATGHVASSTTVLNNMQVSG